MSSQELRQKFREFFESKGHTWIPGASLVPANDPSVLFTTAGMHPLVPYLLGADHPHGKRLANIQRCLRTDDIDEVGDDIHLTFFEMLGNWSLGDYGKKESISWSREFLTDPKWLGLEAKYLAVTIFAGDNDAPVDSESEKIWLEQPGFLGQQRIKKLGKQDNWWPTGGGTSGPCGPDTEIFYWTGEGEPTASMDKDDSRWVEIWNNVFMQYERQADGIYKPLSSLSVDTGMGFERMVSVLQGKKTIFETDLFAPIINAIRNTGVEVGHRNERIIADHLRAVVFLAMDGVVPSNKDQGYVMRRLLRRALAKLNIDEKSVGIESIAQTIIDTYSDAYPDLKTRQSSILEIIRVECQKFLRTLHDGLKTIEKVSAGLSEGSEISGQVMFDLFTTFGIPVELQPELFDQNLHLKFNNHEFEELFKKHQQQSQAGAEQKFKGGLADTSEQVVKLHTATHLLHEALKRVLGDRVEQRGSNITAERLRFDFTQDTKMTEEQLKQTEELVNDIIKQDLPVERQLLPKEEAMKLGARSIFGEKYGDQVSVYSIGPDKSGQYFSREFCGGPHVTHTGEIGTFKIIKEEASSSGIRRIKATVS